MKDEIQQQIKKRLKIWIYFDDGKIIKLPNETANYTMVSSFPGQYTLINISQIALSTGSKMVDMIEVFFYPHESFFNVRFDLLDEVTFSFRNKLENTNQETLVKGLTKVLMASFIEQEKNPLYSAKCREYTPTNTLFDCDLDSARTIFEARDMNLPFWIGNQSQRVGMPKTKTFDIVDINAVYNFVVGASDLYCSDPCQYVQIKSNHVSEYQGGEKSRSVSAIAFPRKITKRIEKLANYNPLVMLSLIGGNIGLWLGWSVLQGMNVFISWMT